MSIAGSPCEEVPKPVAESAARILEARRQARREVATAADWEALGVLLAQQRQASDAASDRVLALLANFYLGEANDTDVQEALLQRGGERVEPLVAAYQNRPPCDLGFPELLLAPEARAATLGQLLEMLAAGETLGTD